MAHDQPTYASVPGIRVFGMMCVKPGNSVRKPTASPLKSDSISYYQQQNQSQQQQQQHYPQYYRSDNSRSFSTNIPTTTNADNLLDDEVTASYLKELYSKSMINDDHDQQKHDTNVKN